MSLKDAFAGMRDEAPEPKRSSAQAPRRASSPAPAAMALHGSAKSRHPEFEAVKIYVRKETRKRAWRKWEDAGGGDFSDLVQMLLAEYLSA
jgi:hypothetical protein